LDGFGYRYGKEYKMQQRIKKLYSDAIECARAEGARGQDIRRIAMDYISVLKMNGSCPAEPMELSNG